MSMLHEVSIMRLDKFLWCIRFFKTRSLATKACGSGKIRLETTSKRLKASHSVQIGEVYALMGKKISVQSLPKSRLKATLATQFYKDLSPLPPVETPPVHLTGTKPTKKQRRSIAKFLSGN